VSAPEHGAGERILRELDALRLMVERLKDERDAWEDTAVQQTRNTDFYARMLDKIALLFGKDAYVSDDGSVQDSPLRAKVPDMVAGLKLERDEAVAALAESDRGRTEQLRIIMDLRERLENMDTLLCAAAPLAWAHGVDVDGAHEWEKQAKALIEAGAKVDGR